MGQNIFYKVKWRIAIFFVFLAACTWMPISIADESQATGLIGVKTIFSDGDLPLDKIIQEARPKNIKVIITGDDALRKWTYGLWPLRNIIKKTHQDNSILKMGAEVFLNQTGHIQKENPDIIIIPGARVSPFYAWSGSPFRRNLVLSGWNRKFLVLGLNSAKDYELLPMVSNDKFVIHGLRDISRLWPLLFLFLGLWLALKKKVFEFQGLKYTVRSRYRLLGQITVILSVILFIDNLHFSASKFDPYEPHQTHQSILPYQEMIDYVLTKGGLIFWLDPTVSENTRLGYGLLTTWTEPSEAVLSLSHDYTGICIDSCDGLAFVGGAWDRLLKDYCLGKIKKPIWIAGDTNLYLAGQKQIRFYVANVFLDSVSNAQDVLEALKGGRFYLAFQAENKIIKLDDFSFLDPISGVKVCSGQELAVTSDSGIIHMQGQVMGATEQDRLNIELIKDGRVIFKALDLEAGRFNLEFNDTEISGKSFYRLKISISSGGWLLTNPIFVLENINK